MYAFKIMSLLHSHTVGHLGLLWYRGSKFPFPGRTTGIFKLQYCCPLQNEWLKHQELNLPLPGCRCRDCLGILSAHWILGCQASLPASGLPSLGVTHSLGHELPWSSSREQADQGLERQSINSCRSQQIWICSQTTRVSASERCWVHIYIQPGWGYPPTFLFKFPEGE